MRQAPAKFVHDALHRISVSHRHNVGVDTVRFDANGLVAAVVQQWDTREVLMLAWMDAAALEETLRTGWATFYSRSRATRWVKGETSGNRQRVKQVLVDCDGDAVLVLVDQVGVACHTGARSCFDSGELNVQ